MIANNLLVYDHIFNIPSPDSCGMASLHLNQKETTQGFPNSPCLPPDATKQPHAPTTTMWAGGWEGWQVQHCLSLATSLDCHGFQSVMSCAVITVLQRFFLHWSKTSYSSPEAKALCNSMQYAYDYSSFSLLWTCLNVEERSTMRRH